MHTLFEARRTPGDAVWQTNTVWRRWSTTEATKRTWRCNRRSTKRQWRCSRSTTEATEWLWHAGR
jgi:hypothetical protein